MKKLLLFLCAMGLSLNFTVMAEAIGYTDLGSFLANAPGTTLVNFDTDQNGNAFDGSLVGRYSDWGIEFGPEDHTAGAAGPVSSPYGWFVDQSSLIVFDAFFTSPDVYALGLHHVLYSGSRGATLFAYDNGGALIGSVASDTDPDSLDFFGLILDTPISSFEVVFNSPPGGWGLDDLYFGGEGNAPAVPEPSTMILLGVGLVGLLGLGKKKLNK